MNNREKYEVLVGEWLEDNGYKVKSTRLENEYHEFDFYVEENNTPNSIVEVRSRELITEGEPCTLENLKNRGNNFMVSSHKIENNKLMSENYGVPFKFMAYLIPEKILLIWNITDEKGNYLIPFESATFETQKSLQGGKAIRTNYFLPIELSEKITMNDPKN